MANQVMLNVKFLEGILDGKHLRGVKVPETKEFSKKATRQEDILTAFAHYDLLSKKAVAHRNGVNENDFVGNFNTDNICDILIICPLPKELVMTCLVFGKDFEDHDDIVDGVKVFQVDLERKKGRTLKIVITSLNAQYNVNAAARTPSRLHRNKPELAILTGISGAFQGKSSLGHVCICETVFYTETGARVGDLIEQNPQITSCSRIYTHQAQNFEMRAEKNSWKKGALDSLLEMHKELSGEYTMPKKKMLQENGVGCTVDDVITTELLQKTGKIYDEAMLLSRRIRAVEMEAYGFAAACDEANVPWMIFRGFCDFSDEKKTDLWQKVAAYNSAFALRSFLETDFRLKDEMTLT